MSHYKDDTYDTGFPDRAKEYIDGKVHDGLKSAYRGGLQVLGSGFGKGVLVAAAITTLAVVGIALAAPAVLGFGTGMSASLAISSGLSYAGNLLLGSGLGWAILAAGGATGSLIAVHNENGRLSQEAAEAQAAAYAQAREAGDCSGPDLPPPAAAMDHDITPPKLPPGHHANALNYTRNRSREMAV